MGGIWIDREFDRLPATQCRARTTGKERNSDRTGGMEMAWEERQRIPLWFRNMQERPKGRSRNRALGL